MLGVGHDVDFDRWSCACARVCARIRTDYQSYLFKCMRKTIVSFCFRACVLLHAALSLTNETPQENSHRSGFVCDWKELGRLRGLPAKGMFCSKEIHQTVSQPVQTSLWPFSAAVRILSIWGTTAFLSESVITCRVEVLGISVSTHPNFRNATVISFLTCFTGQDWI
jgi:hypothetical protein